MEKPTPARRSRMSGCVHRRTTCDPHNNNQPVSVGDPAGKIVRVTANFGYEPAFGNFLVIRYAPIHAISSGGVPTLDVAICFDVSGSIDDQTPVTFVRRQWDSTASRTRYNVAQTTAGSRAGNLAKVNCTTSWDHPLQDQASTQCPHNTCKKPTMGPPAIAGR